MSTPPTGFAAREKAASVMTASTVFIWGGASSGGSDLSDGALYDPRTDEWTTLPSMGSSPQARVLATAVWTGSIVVVWGGGDDANTSDYATGGRFDPSTKTWQPMTTQGAPIAARAPFGVWTGSRVLFYGGTTSSDQPVLSVALYDPVKDAWSLGDTSSHTAPSPLLYPTVAWTGSVLLVVNGQGHNGKSTSALTSYDPSSNIWTSGPNGPSARYGAFGTWLGTGLLDWAGNSSSQSNDGELYDPLPNKWTSLQSSNAPASRWAAVPETGWTTRPSEGVALVLGGLGFTSGSFYTDGAVYDSGSSTWTQVPSSPSGEAHLWGAGVWTGSEFAIWGGEPAPSAAPTTTGERYRVR